MKTTRIAAITSLLLLAACTASTGDYPYDESMGDPSEMDGTIDESGEGARRGAVRGSGPRADWEPGMNGEEGLTPAESASGAGPSQDDFAAIVEDDPEAPLPPLTPENWMQAIPGLAKKPLNQIVVPGTHDSGTYSLISTYLRPVDDAFAPDAEFGTKIGSFTDQAEKWAKAQSKDLKTQLADGMRYIDLRPCREKSGVIRICHGLYGPYMGDLLSDIREFADAHPKEIIFVDMNGKHYGFVENDYFRLGEMVRARLGPRLVDYSAGDVTPTMTLEELRKKHPNQNVFVLGDTRVGKQIFPRDGSTLVNSWPGTWNRDKLKEGIEKAFPTAGANTFFITSLQPTPDATLIVNANDPLTNFPDSLKELAEDANPVTLGWVRDHWSKQRLNFLILDFYEDTCLYKLAMKLNGAEGIDLGGCRIGTETKFGNYAWGPYGRGAGNPMVCDSSQEMIAGLCYTKCQPGYSSSIWFPTVCSKPCPAGYRDDGLTCFRDASIISANNSSCPWYDKCGLTLKKGCSTCPAGYHNDGCTCRRDPHAIVKTRYDRGVGVIPSSCRPGEEKDGLLCYPKCGEHYDGVGPMCWPKN